MSSPEPGKEAGDLRMPSDPATGVRVPPADIDAPGVPGFRRWRGVYLFAIGCFVAFVVALTVFTHFYG